jgi:hypothetical protein
MWNEIATGAAEWPGERWENGELVREVDFKKIGILRGIVAYDHKDPVPGCSE